MKLIVGLGNPEVKYILTRHNMGFWAIDELCAKWKISLNQKYAYGLYGTGRVGQEPVTVVKPLTYMNSSGICVLDLANKLHLGPEDVIVLYDDMAIPVGKLRLRIRGGAGSHNGMKSIIEELGSENFPRVRIGIGEPPEGTRGMDFVLGAAEGEERELLQAACARAADAVDLMIRRDIECAMRQYNV